MKYTFTLCAVLLCCLFNFIPCHAQKGFHIIKPFIGPPVYKEAESETGEAESIISKLPQNYAALNYVPIANLKNSNKTNKGPKKTPCTTIIPNSPARSGDCSHGNWQPIGLSGMPVQYPYGTATGNGNGRLDCIAFSPTDTNIIYIGSGGGGGLWKYNIALDSSVSLNTDHIPAHNGVGAVAAIPGRLIIATGDCYVNVWWSEWPNTCTGVYYSDNDGVSWNNANVYNADSSLVSLSYGTNYNYVSHIAVDPSDSSHLFMTFYNIAVIYDTDSKHSGALYVSHDAGSNWYEVNDNALGNRYFQDVAFDPVHPNLVYASSQRLYKSIDGGNTWADVTGKLNSLPAAPTGTLASQVYRMWLMVPNKGCAAADSNNVAAVVAIPSSSDLLLYHSTDAFNSSLSNSLVLSQADELQLVMPFHYGMKMTQDPNQLYMGGNVLQFSVDGGANFYTNRSYSANDIHNDCQQIGVPPYNGHNAGVVYACTDGGLFRSTDSSQTFTAHNKGLIVNQIWGLGVSQVDNTLLAGAQDNSSWHKDNTGTWTAVDYGDGNRFCAVNSNNTAQYAWTDPQSNSGVTTTGGAIITTTGISQRPYMYEHDKPNTLLIATDRFYRVNNGVVSYGDIFKHALPAADTPSWPSGNYAVAFAYCYNNPAIIYLSTSSNATVGSGDTSYYVYNLFKSTDSGASWQDISPKIAGVTGYQAVGAPEVTISAIAVHPNNPNVLWITYKNYGTTSYGNENVYMSTDGGSTWTNYSDGLPLGSTLDIIYQLGSNDDLYIALDQGVYHRNASMSSWECYDLGLPYTHITDLDISYCSGKLYAATFGRGIWATDLYINVNPGQTDTVSSNTTWDSVNKYITGGYSC